jgi:hypothetical protein
MAMTNDGLPRRDWLRFAVTSMALLVLMPPLGGVGVPFVLHEVLGWIGQDHWITWGVPLGGTWITLLPPGAERPPRAIAQEFRNQLAWLPLFAVLALPATLGIAVLASQRGRTVSLKAATLLGATPGTLLAIARTGIGISANEWSLWDLRTAIGLWVNFGLPMAVAAAICARVIRRWQ